MKTNRLFALLLAAVMLTGCAQNTTSSAPDSEVSASTPESTPESATESKPDTTTAQPEESEPEIVVPEGHVYVDFKNGAAADFECADGWCNGNPFNVTWRRNNVTFNDGKMQLIIDNDIIPKDGIPYSGGEYRSKGFYGFGRYEVSLKAIKNDGVVSSFFTYTGPTDGNPWDEIDVEILGKDTTKVQFNYYTNGRGSHEYMHDLGFDASEDFHTYAFEWHKDKIVWFIDGEEVYTATDNIPSVSGKIMMNAWCGKGVDGWLNAFTDGNIPLTAEYEWIKFTPFEEQ